MTKWGFALPCNVVADGWVERKSSGNLISYALTRLNSLQQIHAERPYLPPNLYSSASQTSLDKCGVTSAMPAPAYGSGGATV
jgi:hypothetical protein